MTPRLFEQIFDLLPKLSIDLFATCPGALYAFPLTPLLTAGLGRIWATWRPVLLLAPAWPKQPWYSSLVELSVTHVVHLPLDQFPLLRENFTHPLSNLFRLHAWTLLGMGLKDRDSLRALPASWLSRYGLQRVLSTTESGTSSVLGVQRDRSILSLSL